MDFEIQSYQDLKKVSVRNNDGDTLGEVHDIVMDIQTGHIAYAVLSSGGFLGIGEKYLPVPYEALQYDRKNNNYLMHISKEKFQDAPHIDRKKWPTRPDQKYIQEVYAYYGYQRKG